MIERIIAAAAAAALVVASAGGCHVTGGATYLVAVGARDRLPAWQGVCDTSTARPSGLIEFQDANYRALGPGSVTIACERGKLVLDVREAATLVIDGPGDVAGRYALYRVLARDRSGQTLIVGEHAEVTWETSPSLERHDGCHGDILPTCAGADAVHLRTLGGGGGGGGGAAGGGAAGGGAAGEGEAEIRVHFAGKTATRKVQLR